MKMVTPKRLLDAVLALALMLPLAACSGNTASPAASPSASNSQTGGQTDEKTYYNATGYPICDETITVTLSGPNSISNDWNQTVMVKEFEKRLGIKLDCTSYASSDWETQLNLMIASDSLPDILCGSSISLYQSKVWGEDGYFLDMGKYLELMPNLVALFESNPSYKATFTTDTGSLYGLNQINTAAFSGSALTFINNTWLKNVGKEVPTTVDELYDVLKAFKAQDANGNGDPNDEIPFGYSTGGYAVPDRTLLDAFGVNSASTDYCLQVDENGKVVLGNMTENYKAYLEFMQTLYKEGLLDSEAFIQTGSEFLAKGNEGRYGFYGGNEPAVVLGTDVSEDGNWSSVMGLTSAYNDKQSVTVSSGINGTVRVAVNGKTKYPEAIMRMIDYFYTDEGRSAVHYGYEGLTFEYVTDSVVNGRAPVVVTPADFTGSDYRSEVCVINYGFVLNFVTSKFEACASVNYDSITDSQFDELVSAYGWVAPFYKAFNRTGITRVNAFPNVAYTDEEEQARKSLHTDIRTYLTATKAEFITGTPSIESGWSAYLAELEKMGVKELLSIEQAAYDRYAENLD